METGLGGVPSLRRQEQGKILLNCLLGTLLFCMTFLVVQRLLIELPDCDYGAHLEKAEGLTKSTIPLRLLKGEDILWHVCVWTLVRTGMERVCAAALVTAAVNGIQFAVCSCLFDRTLRWVDRRWIPAASMTLCLVTAICLPWFSQEIYVGQDSPNVWHNPTQLMVRPLALLVFWLTVRLYERLRQGDWSAGVYAGRGEAALYTLLITLSVWSKPSFFQAFVPGLGLVMVVDLIRSRGQAFPGCFKIALAYVPGAVLTVLRFFTAFYTGAGEGVEIAPLEYWNSTSPCVPVSILLLFAFPLIVFVADWKEICRSAEGQIALSALLMATAMRGLLIEQGARRWHGNFTWAYGVASMLVWFVALGRFAGLMGGSRLSGKRYQLVAYLGWSLLALHLLTGIYYYIQILTGPYQC